MPKTSRSRSKVDCFTCYMHKGIQTICCTLLAGLVQHDGQQYFVSPSGAWKGRTIKERKQVVSFPLF